MYLNADEVYQNVTELAHIQYNLPGYSVSGCWDVYCVDVREEIQVYLVLLVYLLYILCMIQSLYTTWL